MAIRSPGMMRNVAETRAAIVDSSWRKTRPSRVASTSGSIIDDPSVPEMDHTIGPSNKRLVMRHNERGAAFRRPG